MAIAAWVFFAYMSIFFLNTEHEDNTSYICFLPFFGESKISNSNTVNMKTITPTLSQSVSFCFVHNIIIE